MDPGVGHVYAAFTSNVDVITTSSGAITTVTLASYGLRSGIAVNPTTHEVFLSNRHEHLLDVIDGTTLAYSQVASTGSAGWWVTTNPTENKVYVTTASWNGYWILDRDTGSTTIVGSGFTNDATTLFYSPRTNRVYTDSEVDGVMSVIDGATDSYFTLPTESASGYVGIVDSTGHLYLVSMGGAFVIDENAFMIEAIPISNPTPSSIVYQGVAVNQTTGRVYMINDGSALGAVTVIQDTPHLTRPPVLVGSSGAMGVIRFDPVTRQSTDTRSPGGPFGLVFSPGGRRFYVGTQWDVQVFDGRGSHSSPTTISDTGGGTFGGPKRVALTPDGSRLYATNRDADNVGVINTATNALVTTVTVGDSPYGIAATPDGAKVYVANNLGPSVSVISTASNTVSATITPDWAPIPAGVAVNPSRNARLCGPCPVRVSGRHRYRDRHRNHQHHGRFHPHWLAVAPDGKRLYVTNNGSGNMSVIDTGTNAVTDTVDRW